MPKSTEENIQNAGAITASEEHIEEKPKSKGTKDPKKDKAKTDKKSKAKSEKDNSEKDKAEKEEKSKTKKTKSDDVQKNIKDKDSPEKKKKQNTDSDKSSKKKDEKNKQKKTDKKKTSSDSKEKAKTATPDSKEENSKKKTEKSKEEKSANSQKEETAETKKKNTKKSSIKQLGGALFAKMMRGGASKLRANAEEVNKLNVFPVPDGDTGDNMSMTIESGVASLENLDTDDLAQVLQVASKGMLLGARGNSGVILSQFFAGMAKGLENAEIADAKMLGQALEKGVEQAYTSVMTPTEGTILTVAREAVEYAVGRVNAKSTVQSLFSDLVKEMNASLARTPDLLPALGEAGVVDSGGAGLLYIIDGLNRVLNGEDIEDAEVPTPPPAKNISINESSFGPDSNMEYGYCTELLVQLMNRKMVDNPFDLDMLKLYLTSHGDSVVVFQTDSIVKIHVHTLRPDKIMRYMIKFGDFISVKVENMTLQHTELKTDEEDKASEEVPAEKPILPWKKYGIVAVSNGVGISNLFRELGADAIVEGGQTNNPSTNDFLEAFESINADHIFVFPNNGNIIMAATQAAEIYEKAKVYVIPSKSIGAGYVALSSMGFDFSEPDALIAEATDAISRITSAYISPAVRDADLNGVHVTDGDTMGIMEKEIVISGPDKMVSTYGLIDIMLSGGDKYMITVFYGKDATPEERDMLADYMLKTYPSVEAYFIDGGQDIYPFLFISE